MTTVTEGVVIGGAVAGLTVWIVQLVHAAVNDCLHKRRVYVWLRSNTRNEPGEEFRSTRAIASWNNLTENRVRYICSHHRKIFLSTGQNEDMWSIYGHRARGV